MMQRSGLWCGPRGQHHIRYLCIIRGVHHSRCTDSRFKAAGMAAHAPLWRHWCQRTAKSQAHPDVVIAMAEEGAPAEFCRLDAASQRNHPQWKQKHEAVQQRLHRIWAPEDVAAAYNLKEPSPVNLTKSHVGNKRSRLRHCRGRCAGEQWRRH